MLEYISLRAVNAVNNLIKELFLIMKNYSYTATIRMWNDNEVKEIKFDNSDLNELKKDIISIFNANRAEYPKEQHVYIEKFEMLSCGAASCGVVRIL